MTKSIDVDTRTRLIAGVSVPDSPLITEALEYAHKLYEPYLFNHAMRSWLFAAKIGQSKGIDCDLEVVAVGTILHDIGLTAAVSGSNRFEVNGAAASALVRQGTRPLESPRAALLGPHRSQLDTLHRASQGGGSRPGHHGHRARLWRVCLRADPVSGHDRQFSVHSRVSR